MHSDRSSRITALAELFHQTSEDHHTAFKQTDGIDPDWSIWYASHLLENGIEQLLNAQILKSDLIFLLVGADKEIATIAPGARWESWYATRFIDRFLPELEL